MTHRTTGKAKDRPKPTATNPNPNAPPTSSKFQELAASRGVDLPAEQERARQQIESGQTIGGGGTGETIGRRATAAEVDLTGLNRIQSTSDLTSQESPFRTEAIRDQFEGGFAQPSLALDRPDNPSFIEKMFTIPPQEIGTDKEGNPIITKKINALQILAFMGIAPITKSNAILSSPNWRIGGDIGKKAAGAGASFASNTVTRKLTAKLLLKAGVRVALNPLFLASIGSYPFSYFIKSEALQIIRGTYTGAMIADNPEAAQAALDRRAEILNPTVWDNIIQAVPIANSVKQLLDLFQTATIAVAIDQQILDDKNIQIATGETEDEKWTRVRELETDQQQTITDNRLAAQTIFDNNRNEAILAGQKADRAEDKKFYREQARFWAEEREKERRLEEEERIAIAKFWLEYRKAAQKIREDSRPSNLNFGLL